MTNFINNRAKCGGAIYAESNITLINIAATSNSGSALCITDCNITFTGTLNFQITMECLVELLTHSLTFGGAINSKNYFLQE